MDDLFIDVTTLPHDGYGGIQLAFLGVAYGYILYKASKLIADGAELLTLIMDAGFVGAVILPVLGAVPDGAIVLFSGLGNADPEQQARELQVGVGTLAGSTIMLLTLPWFASVFLGRVNLSEDGKTALYRKKSHEGSYSWNFFKTGVQVETDVRINGLIMAATAISYFVIQGPSWAGNASSSHAASLAALIISALLFLAYCVYQFYSSKAQEYQRLRAVEARKKAFANHVLDLATLASIEETVAGNANSTNSPALKGVIGGDVTSAALRKIFDQYDTDKSGALSKPELRAMFKELGYRIANEELDGLLTEIGGADRLVQFEEFEKAISVFIRERLNNSRPGSRRNSLSHSKARVRSINQTNGASAVLLNHADEEEEDDDDEEEEEDEHSHLTPGQIRMKALLTLLAGVILVTLFSDPMVGVLGEVGSRTNIDPFYISFIVTPLISNASELISSIVFAGRKTKQSITMTLSALLGAATMNNTFCLAIFAAIVYSKNLEWQFSSQVTVILICEFVLAGLAFFTTVPLWLSSIAIAVYPLSLILVKYLPVPASN